MKTSQLKPAGARAVESPQWHVRRPMEKCYAASPQRGSDSAADRCKTCLHSIAGPVRTALPEASRPGEPLPIWLAVLLATSCEAQRNGVNHAVCWSLVSGRAVYTNSGRDVEHIEPLGVSLSGGHSIAVSWMPGETAYTVEVYRQAEKCA